MKQLTSSIIITVLIIGTGRSSLLNQLENLLDLTRVGNIAKEITSFGNNLASTAKNIKVFAEDKIHESLHFVEEWSENILRTTPEPKRFNITESDEMADEVLKFLEFNDEIEKDNTTVVDVVLEAGVELFKHFQFNLDQPDEDANTFS